MLKTYLKQLHTICMQGDAREESYYSALEPKLNLLKQVAARRHKI